MTKTPINSACLAEELSCEDDKIIVLVVNVRRLEPVIHDIPVRFMYRTSTLEPLTWCNMNTFSQAMNDFLQTLFDLAPWIAVIILFVAVFIVAWARVYAERYKTDTE